MPTSNGGSVAKPPGLQTVPAQESSRVMISHPCRMRVLYLFAGVKRRSDMGDALTQALLECFGQRGQNPPDLSMEEIDTMRGGMCHNLLDHGISANYLSRISEGCFDVVIVAPPCNTFTRAVFANR